LQEHGYDALHMNRNDRQCSNSIHPRHSRRLRAAAWGTAAFAIAGSWLAATRASATEHDSGAWAIFSTANVLGHDDGQNPWRYHFDAQVRLFDLGGGAEQYLLRPGIGYQLNDKVSLWGGYARFYTRTSSGDSASEDRLWQHVAWKAGSPWGGSLSMRLRLEQRSVSIGDDIGVVLRYQLKYSGAFGKSDRTEFFVAIEPFADLRDTDWGGRARISQNRTSLGFGWKSNPRWGLELGYMNQLLMPARGENIVNHLAVAHFIARFGGR
jgi:hypothetical protein